jgi:hypothetical protein
MVHIPFGRISCMTLTLRRFFNANVGYICSWRVIIHPWFATIRTPRRPLICQQQSDPIALGSKIFTIHYPTCMTNDTEWIGPMIVWCHSPHLNTSKGGLPTSAWWGWASGVSVVHHKPFKKNDLLTLWLRPSHEITCDGLWLDMPSHEIPPVVMSPYCAYKFLLPSDDRQCTRDDIWSTGWC